MGNANISNQAKRIVYYSLVSYSHRNEQQRARLHVYRVLLMGRLSSRCNVNKRNQNSSNVDCRGKKSRKRIRESNIGSEREIKGAFHQQKQIAIMNRIRNVPIKWKPCQKRFLNSNCLHYQWFRPLQFSWEKTWTLSCARWLNVEKLRSNVPIGSISMEINSETWLGT